MAFLRNIFQDTLEMFVFDLGFCHGFSQLVPANTLTRLKVFVVRNCPHYIKKLAHIQRFTHNIMTLIHHIKKLAHIKRFTHNIMALTHHTETDTSYNKKHTQHNKILSSYKEQVALNKVKGS